MADIDTNLIGQIITSIPYSEAFGSPLAAAIDAQTKAAKSSLDFILNVGFTKITNADGVEVQQTNYACPLGAPPRPPPPAPPPPNGPPSLLTNIPQLEI